MNIVSTSAYLIERNPIICRGETRQQEVLLKTNQLQECVTKVRNNRRCVLKRIIASVKMSFS